jgi:hypothetical protein
MALIFDRNHFIQHGKGNIIDDFLEALDTNKFYIITLNNNKKYRGKIYINHDRPKKIIEFQTAGYVGEMRIPYDNISTIIQYNHLEGGKRINYSTKKSKNRRHTSRRRRTSKKHSGTKKHRRRRA